ncbi:sugar ABC transporter ATP-binding protein [Jannaschia sp. LMIT008]|uniref:sugar ABC transporter ATP-binding protein n=1 Tax=Jannaschia maritima TaxID=3032585 RepID=UPI002811C4E0|nr:sugar ABC transporter ATP-binding protein [Jannaschia sp. LMIT008]
MTDGDAILEVRGLTKRFPGVLALDDVSLAFRPGEVHAVIGENGAGKSTLMHVLGGDLSPDAGAVYLGGAPVRLAGPLDAQSRGIGVVYQELALCRNLTVAENVTMPTVAARGAVRPMPRAAMRDMTRRALARLGMGHVDPDTPVSRLSVAEMQMVEIARAIGRDVRVLVLDEPNSALSPRESEELFRVVRQLRGEGVCVLYVSHYLDEVLGLADRISVLRDGRHVETMNAADADEDRLIRAMVGRDLVGATPFALSPAAEASADAPAVLEVAGLACAPDVADVSFTLRAGEILGVGGLPDSGKDSLGDALFGLRPRSGSVRVDGREVGASSGAALRAGLAYIPADRRNGGMLSTMSVAHNVVASTLGAVSWAGILRRRAVERTARAQVARLDARISSLGQRIATLSGGNQQKIILSRGLVSDPRVLILHEPTRGVDVGAKAEIYAILRDVAAEGVGIVMITSEMTELVLQASRVVVVRAGRLSDELTGAAITEEAIMQRAVP